MDTKFNLHLETVTARHRVNAQSLSAALRDCVSLLQELDHVNAGGVFQWYVSSFQFGSASVEVDAVWPQVVDAPPEDEVESMKNEIAEKVLRGVEHLSQSETMPIGFSIDALRA